MNLRLKLMLLNCNSAMKLRTFTGVCPQAFDREGPISSDHLSGVSNEIDVTHISYIF